MKSEVKRLIDPNFCQAIKLKFSKKRLHFEGHRKAWHYRVPYFFCKCQILSMWGVLIYCLLSTDNRANQLNTTLINKYLS